MTVDATPPIERDARGIWSDEVGPLDGPLVVLVHGAMDRSTGMLKLSRQLDRTCRVLRYDRRGYGRSSPHPGPFAMDDQVGDLVELLRGRTADVVVGHSYGGNVALSLAARHPGLVRAVSIYETPLSWEAWWPGTTAGAVAVAAAGDPEGAAERFMRRLIGDARWEALPERTRAQRLVEGVAMVGELADLRTNRPWEADAIVVPVLAGYGTGGSPHHRTGMEHVASTVSGAVAVELDGCRHDAPLSHPALFARLMVLPLLADPVRHGSSAGE
ncbi:MAG: alpha/beta hydrolase [Ilumatobacteraceae bacterium]